MYKSFFYLFLLFSFATFGQNLHLQINGTSALGSKTIDSLGYEKIHNNLNSIYSEMQKLELKCQNIGFFTTKLLELTKISDSLFITYLNLGIQQKSILIHINKKDQAFLEVEKDKLLIGTADLENYMQQLLKKIESKGFSLAKIKLQKIKTENNLFEANLNINLGEKRLVNDIVINGYEKFPESHKLALKRFYKSKTFNLQNLENLSKNVSQFRFIKQIKYPEILFTEDSTKVFVYVQKNNASSFDGLLGFANDANQKLVFTGYINVALQNIINSGEKFSVYWKNDGQQQTTFNANLEVPYIFNSNLGIKAQLNIFKQDSTFQTTQTNLNLGYFLNYNRRLYLGFQSSESSDIQNINSSTLNDFKNNFVTANFEAPLFDSSQLLFPDKMQLFLKLGSGKRIAKLQTDSQFFAQLNANYHLQLNNRNSVHLKIQNYYLQSSNYIINEMQRFGGINSIRGFNENSLQANAFSGLFTEYRYLLSSNLYLHSVIDYAYIEDKTSNLKDRLLGFGFGFGLLNKNGLFNLIYANGSSQNQPIILSNSVIQIGLKANF